MQRGLISAADGTTIAYTVHGRGDQVVLQSNGIGCNEVFLRYLTEDLSQKFRVINWHYRGHMDSELPKNMDYLSFPHLVDDLKRVLDHLEVEQAVFLGFSMGVEINFEFYRLFPERVQALIPICGTFEFCLKSFFGIQALEPILLRLLQLAERHPGIIERIWRRTVGGRLAFPLSRLFIFNRKRVKKSDFLDYHPHISNIDKSCFLKMAYHLAQHTARDLLPDIQVPTLVIAGTKDNFTPLQVSKEMAGMIPNARLVEIKGGTHGTLIEFPEEVNPPVIAFIEELEQG